MVESPVAEGGAMTRLEQLEAKVQGGSGFMGGIAGGRGADHAGRGSARAVRCDGSGLGPAHVQSVCVVVVDGFAGGMR